MDDDHEERLMTERTRPDRRTREADRADSKAAHRPDRAPTASEEEAAEDQSVTDSARAAYEDMAERGANAEGEGRLP
jgi:hypothetical protein